MCSNSKAIPLLSKHLLGVLYITIYYAQYLKCAAAHLVYLGIEVDDALEIAEQTEVHLAGPVATAGPDDHSRSLGEPA